MTQVVASVVLRTTKSFLVIKFMARILPLVTCELISTSACETRKAVSSRALWDDPRHILYRLNTLRWLMSLRLRGTGLLRNIISVGIGAYDFDIYVRLGGSVGVGAKVGPGSGIRTRPSLVA